MGLTRQQRAALLAAGFILSLILPVAFVAAESFISGFYGTTGTTHWNASDGPEVILPADYNLQSGNPFTVHSMNVSTQNNGWVNLSSTGSTTVQVDRIGGTWTNVSSLDVTGAALTIDPHDKDAATVDGDPDSFGYKGTLTPDDDVVDFTYSGASGTTNVTLRGLSASTQYGAIDADTGDVLDISTADGSGTVTFEEMPNSAHDVEIETGVAPIVENSTASPTGDLTTSSPTLSIDIKDVDFDPGDNVTAEFFLDGSSAGNQTLTANGTVTQSVSVTTGGNHTWHVVATDAYGKSTTSQTFDIKTPDELLIRNETNASQLVTGVEVSVTAYYSGSIIRRNTTTGSINLTGFPVDEPIVIRATADGYYSRTAVIEDIFEQQSAYLLSDNESSYLIRFDLSDPTGDFARPDTVLFVERDIELNGTVDWRVVAGDDFGIQGVPVNLVADERYRIRIKNLETGDVATLGSFTAIQSETVTLSPAAPTFDFEDIEQEYAWSASENESAQTITVEYEDTAGLTDTVKITIHERYNNSNVLVNNQTFTNSQSIVFSQPLTNAEVNKTWAVDIYVERDGGWLHFSEPIGGGPRSLLPPGLDAVWRTSIGVFVLLISSMAFSELNRKIGAVVTALIGGVLWWVGLLSGVTTGPAVVLAITVGVVYSFRGGVGGFR